MRKISVVQHYPRNILNKELFQNIACLQDNRLIEIGRAYGIPITMYIFM